MSELSYILDGGLTAAVLYLVYDLRMRMIKMELTVARVSELVENGVP